MNPGDPVQRRDLGVSLLQAGQPGKALDHLNAYLEAVPLAADMEKAKPVTVEMIQQAEWISGIKLSDDDRKSMVGSLNAAQRNYEAGRTES